MPPAPCSISILNGRRGWALPDTRSTQQNTGRGGGRGGRGLEDTQLLALQPPKTNPGCWLPVGSGLDPRRV
jgi:hypothetical protein